ncbi:FAD-dependent monooxygenase [Streptomyces sclerotialus]|uniref:FAD-dependent monooxygenase n=1 Tax=Streptomyces sclerotialus TaxID=1957 RepID=UPI0006917A23
MTKTTERLDTQVIVVGAGPVGLMLAGELRLGGADVTVLERRPRITEESRASTLHARTMEIFDSRGLLTALGTPPNERRGHYGGIPMDLTLPSTYPGQWKVPQYRTERLLQNWALTLGADIRRRWEVRELTDDGDSVQVTADTPQGTARVRGAYLVACDGEDSTVRTRTGVGFPGRSTARELLRADVTGLDVPDRRFERLPHGLAIAARNAEGVTRIMVHEFGRGRAPRTHAPDFAEVCDVWHRVTGEDISHGKAIWVNAFGDANRQVTAYRHGRVLFAGDAAHQQMPVGGQALNLGLQDAVNLGWKLALHVNHRAPVGLLDTYHDERHAVGARVLANVRAQSLLLLGGANVAPLRTLMSEMVSVERSRTRLAGLISGLDIRYPVGAGDDPLLGARLPDTVLTAPNGTTTTTTLLRTGRGLLIGFTGDLTAPLYEIAGRWADRVMTVPARPVADAPLAGRGAVLVRPDGHVAWSGSDHDVSLATALRRWFGPPGRAAENQTRGEVSWTRM